MFCFGASTELLVPQAVDGIFHVCRAFDDSDVVHVEDRVNPVEGQEVGDKCGLLVVGPEMKNQIARDPKLIDIGKLNVALLDRTLPYILKASRSSCS